MTPMFHLYNTICVLERAVPEIGTKGLTGGHVHYYSIINFFVPTKSSSYLKTRISGNMLITYPEDMNSSLLQLIQHRIYNVSVKPRDIKLKGCIKFAHNFGIKNNKCSSTCDTIDFRESTRTIMITMVSRAIVRSNAHAHIRVDAVSDTSNACSQDCEDC
jgi:hypothetical protein